MIPNKYLLALCIALSSFTLHAQQPKKPSSSEIFESIKKLNFVGSVLYLAAHPDDENTRLISYMSNVVHARTGYLSLTRGDGGQNLIGTELRELLGLIRTHELLEARRIDGGEQFFTRANDFGFSKHPDETLTIWNKDDVLNDVVWAIRSFQPDIIINRFDHRSPGTTHGHHTASALLSIEAFDLANDAKAYPEQLKSVGLWQPKSVFFNHSWFFYGSQENYDKVDKSHLFPLQIGTYLPNLGLSTTEIASLSRSAHKSQGFGSTGIRGEDMDYLELIKGDFDMNSKSLFEGIDTTWNRLKGGAPIGKLLSQVQTEYDFNNPSASISKLIEAYKLVQKLEDTHWKHIKSEDLKSVIADCAGLYLEVSSNTQQSARNQPITLAIEAINRSNSSIQLEAIGVSNSKTKLTTNTNLKENQVHHYSLNFNIPSDGSYSSPYWLREQGSLGMYHVDDPLAIGKPENDPSLMVDFTLIVNGFPLQYSKPVIYKFNDAVDGEVYKPFEITPQVTVNLADPVIIFDTEQAKDIHVTVKAGRDAIEGYVTIEHSSEWQIFPEKQKVILSRKGESQNFTFTVIPPKIQNESYISPSVHIGTEHYSDKIVTIDYDHIPYQTVVLPSSTKLVRLDIQKRGQHIGYIEGAGDVVPESLRQIGYEVDIIKPDQITAENLSKYDAIVLGIRAYNTVSALKFKQDLLFDFVKKGGNMVVQYNTNHQVLIHPIAPYPLTLSRDRVTEEDAEVRFIDPSHEVLNMPNKITLKDFDGWAQERGLYFPNDWSKEFNPILSMNDSNESPKEGSLLIAKYGKGHYIYTGLSFFREFPEGVSGAYRLFANILSLGFNDITTAKSN